MIPFLADIGIIGGADGPTAIFVTGEFPWLIPVVSILIIGLTLFLILRRNK